MKLVRAYETETQVKDSVYYVIEQDDGFGEKDVIYLTKSQTLLIYLDIEAALSVMQDKALEDQGEEND